MRSFLKCVAKHSPCKLFLSHLQVTRPEPETKEGNTNEDSVRALACLYKNTTVPVHYAQCIECNQTQTEQVVEAEEEGEGEKCT